jgi:hypothetical protein
VTLAVAGSLACGAAVAEPPPLPEPPIVQPSHADPVTLDLGVRLGGSFRIGSAANYPVSSRTGALFGVGVAVAPSSRFAIGLAYEHGELGTEHAEGNLGTVDVDRSLNGVWATVRLTLFHIEPVALAITLGPGLVWQQEDASILALDPNFGPLSAYRCTAWDGPSLGLRAGLGAEIHLGGGFYFDLDTVIDELRLGGGTLGSDALGTCALGPGSTTVAGVRGGFSYRLDVSRYTR